MKADIPSVLGKDGIDGLGAVSSVLEESQTDGTVDNTASAPIHHHKPPYRVGGLTAGQQRAPVISLYIRQSFSLFISTDN